MRDAEAFKPYIARVPEVIAPYSCRYIARGGAVTPLCGAFTPDRLVLMDFPSADDVVAFYFSDAYAPLLRIRLTATEPRFVLMMRSGALPGLGAARGVDLWGGSRAAEPLISAGTVAGQRHEQAAPHAGKAVPSRRGDDRRAARGDPLGRDHRASRWCSTISRACAPTTASPACW